MLERSEPVLKVICATLAALLLFQVVRLVVGRNPLGHLNIPAVPTLPPDTNGPTGGTATNSLAAPGSGKAGTNTAHPGVQIAGAATNAPSGRESGTSGTNVPPSLSVQKGTNPPSPAAATKGDTNSTTEPRPGTKETNTVARPDSARTNLSATPSGATRRGPGVSAGLPPEMATMGMGPFGRPGAMTAPELPLPIRTRVYRITDSEILGPIMRPLPMALLGIAGNVAFLRAANGQTGLVKEGDSLGGLKLIRIGTNRVLVEDDGQKKELTIFSGYGGESLLPKQKDNSQ
jgi:hypothetical protein